MLPTLSLNNMMQFDQTLFDTAPMPTGDVNREVLVNTILINYGEMQVLVPDWSMLRHSINVWFAAHSLQLARLWADYAATYDPLYNKDAYYTETRTPGITRTTQRGIDQTGTRKENPGTVVTESGEEVSQYSGFNSSTFNDVTRELPGRVTTQSGQNDATGSTQTRESVRETEDGQEKTERREYGNIGVTMASELLRDSVSFHRSYNWYDLAAKLWAVDNLVMVY